MLHLDQEEIDKSIQKIEDEEIKSPIIRIRETLISLVSQIRSFDSEAKIISWKTSPNFTYLPEDEFPEDLLSISTYFKGYRANLKADKRVYLKVGLHTPNSQAALQSFVSTWAYLYNYNFKKILIQAEDPAFIGWLAYSTQYTDIEVLKERLMMNTRFEWGFKLVAVTNNDKEEK